MFLKNIQDQRSISLIIEAIHNTERPGGPFEKPGGPSERPRGLSERPGGPSERPGGLPRGLFKSPYFMMVE